MILGMEQYAYLFLALAFSAAALLLLLVRRDFVRAAPKFAAIGAVAGVLVELLYLQDYWRPPTLLGEARISLEDVVVGAALMVIVVFAYPTLKGKVFVHSKSSRPQKKTFYVLALGGALATIVFNLGLGVNSVFTTSAACIAAAGCMLYLRRDLMRVALASAGLLTGLALLIYMVLFNVFAPDFWDTYWLLNNTKYGVITLGNVPLPEMMWYFTWGLLGSICYPFASGRVLADRAKA